MNFVFTKISSNSKLGGCSSVSTEQSSCPERCPFKDGHGCYAEFGPTSWAWKKACKPLSELVAWAKKLPAKWMVRHNVAGDLAHAGTSKLNTELVATLSDAYKGKQAWTYTHCELDADAVEAIKQAERKGFVINASCETHAQVKDALAKGIKAVRAIIDYEQKSWVEDGVRYTVCKNETQGITCRECKLCASKRRTQVVCFPAHGVKTKQAVITLKALNA